MIGIYIHFFPLLLRLFSFLGVLARLSPIMVPPLSILVTLLFVKLISVIRFVGSGTD